MVRQRQADLLLIAATVIAACGWIFSREAIAGMPVFAFLGLRFFFAALLLLPFCRGFRPQKQHWPKLIISGLWFALNLCLWIYSVSTTASLGEGAFIMSLSMMFVPLTAWVMMKVRPPRAWWECLPIAVVGLGLLSLHMPIAFHPSQGWFLLTALVQSIWFCYTSRCAREVPLIPLTTVQLAITGIVGLTISAAVERWDQPMTLPTLGWLVASIVIATSLRFGLQMKGQKYAAVASAAIIMVLEPLLSLLPEVPNAYGRGAWAIVTVVVMAPLFEEVIFRGVLLESTRAKYGVMAAWLVSSAVFGIVHVHPTVAVNAFAIGLVLGFVYMRTDSLWSTIILHAVNNGIAYLALVTGHGNAMLIDLVGSRTLYVLIYIGALAVFAVSGYMMLLALRRLKAEDKNRAAA